MTLGEFEILNALRRDGPLTADELRAACPYPESRTRQGYAAKLVQLEKRALVRRQRSGSFASEDLATAA